MGEHNSPYFAAGCADGERDTAAASACPAQPVLGLDVDREWSWMYRRGYERTYNPSPCACKQCKEGAATS